MKMTDVQTAKDMYELQKYAKKLESFISTFSSSSSVISVRRRSGPLSQVIFQFKDLARAIQGHH